MAMDKAKWDLMIREDVDRIYDRIVLITNIPKNCDKIVLLVEGVYDKRFYEQFIIRKNVIVFYTYGCERMNALAEILRSKNFDYLAIQDSDFSKLGVENSGMINMFFTDCHDYEMTCVENNNVWSRVGSELELSDYNITKEGVFQEIERLSFYRYCSRMRNFFNGFKKMGSIIRESDILDYDTIHNHVDNSHPRFVDIQQGYLNGFMVEYNYVKADPYNLHNGHDFVNRLVYKINQEKNNPYYDCDEEEIQEIICGKTNLTDFKATDLYKNVQAWSASHKVVFKS